jgi:hypothetical protein
MVLQTQHDIYAPLTPFAPVATLQLGGLLVDQMSLAAQQIGDAARRLQELLDKAKLEQSGLQLNVNESILAGSKALMDCIRVRGAIPLLSWPAERLL